MEAVHGPGNVSATARRLASVSLTLLASSSHCSSVDEATSDAFLKASIAVLLPCRDTPAGKDCSCFLHTARATVVALPATHQNQQLGRQSHHQCLCIELVGNRFLRRMVRVLVATAVREALPSAAAAGRTESPLEALMCPGGDRRVTAAPAPALGLCFAAVGYSDAAAMEV
jgi:hypothetical protein